MSPLLDGDECLDLAAKPGSDLGWATVLVVDDDDTSRLLIASMIRRFGIGQVIEAVDGVDGLAKMADLVPDLVVTDIVMPRMDGMELCRRMRADQALADIPILVQTAMTERQSHLQCFAAGASDVLTKPLRSAELRARMQVHLANRRLVFDLRKATTRITREIEGARRMQSALMPKPQRLEAIRHKYGPLIEGMVEPSFSIGGDLWGIIPVDDESFGVYAADFSGHGVMAALNTFRLHAIINDMASGRDDPGVFLGALNDLLVGLLTRGQYATFFYGIINTKRGDITWSGAGIPFPFLLSDDSWCFLDTVGTPLGLDQQARYKNSVLPFPPGSGLFIYSDAMIEATDRSGHALGEQSVLDFLMPEQAHPLAVDLDGILDRFRAKAVLPLKDDLTAIWIRHDGRGQGGGSQPLTIDRGAMGEAGVAAWSAQLGLAAGTGCTQGAVKLIDSADNEGIAAALREAAAVIEISDGAMTLDDATRRALEDGAILLSMTTATVYAHSPSAVLCAHLVENGWIAAGQREDVQLAVQEAVANAVIHGNLGLDSPKGSGAVIRQYWRALSEHLSNRALAARRVTILAKKIDGALVVKIGDEGNGFTVKPRPETGPSGRGSSLMASLTSAVHWEDGGRTIILTFVAQNQA